MSAPSKDELITSLLRQLREARSCVLCGSQERCEACEEVNALSAQGEAEAVPVAWQRKHPDHGWLDVRDVDRPHYESMGQETRPLFAHPAPAPLPDAVEALRKMLGLFDEQGNIVADFNALQTAVTVGYSALAAVPRLPASVASNYVLVPREPTDEMLDAAIQAHEPLEDDDDIYRAEFKRTYRAMLATLASNKPVGDGYVPYLWQCKDYADGWISYADREEALAYQRDTGCLLRITYRPLAASGETSR